MARYPRMAAGVFAAAGLLLLGTPGVAVARPDAGARSALGGAADAVTQTASASTAFRLSVDPERGTVDVVDTHATVTTRDRTGKITSTAPAGNTVTTLGAAPAAEGTSYTCVVRTQQNSNFRALTPFYSSASGNSYELSWVFHPYTITNARYVSGAYTYQLELCMSGGGHSWNDWHQWFQGAGMTMEDSTPRKIAQTWGNEVKNGQISTTLSFQVAAGPVTIGASTTVTPADTYSGNQGHDANMRWSGNTAWDINRVNAFYVAPHSFTWQGSADFQGNNAHALYEYPMTYPGKISVLGQADSAYLCSLPGQVVGVACDPL